MLLSKLNHTVIEAAIEGFESRKRGIDGQIVELRAMLTGAAQAAATPEGRARKRKKFSAAAIKRMGQAQRQRWAKVKGKAEPASTPESKPKRKLSAAAKASLIANLKKARAAKAAKAKEAAK